MFFHSRLQGIQTRGFHFCQSILPVKLCNAKVVKTSRNVSEWFPILKKNVIFIVNRE